MSSTLISQEIGRPLPHSKECYFHFHNFRKSGRARDWKQYFFLFYIIWTPVDRFARHSAYLKHTYCKNFLCFIQNTQAAQLEYELCFVQLKSEMPFPAAGEGFQTSSLRCSYVPDMITTTLLSFGCLLEASLFYTPTTLVLWTTHIFRKNTTLYERPYRGMEFIAEQRGQ